MRTNRALQPKRQLSGQSANISIEVTSTLIMHALTVHFIA